MVSLSKDIREAWRKWMFSELGRWLFNCRDTDPASFLYHGHGKILRVEIIACPIWKTKVKR